MNVWGAYGFLCSIRGTRWICMTSRLLRSLAARRVISLGCYPQTEVACCHGFLLSSVCVCFFPLSRLFQDLSKNGLAEKCELSSDLRMVFRELPCHGPKAHEPMEEGLVLRWERGRLCAGPLSSSLAPYQLEPGGPSRKQEALALIYWVLRRNSTFQMSQRYCRLHVSAETRILFPLGMGCPSQEPRSPP